MAGLVLLLSLLGGVALLGRLGRALVRLGLRAAEVTTATGMVEISMRRGDLTALAEQRVAQRRARLARRRDLLVGLGWAAWLVVPAFTPWARELYAAAAPLWLLRPGRMRVE